MLDTRRHRCFCWGGRARWLSTEDETEWMQFIPSMHRRIIRVWQGNNTAVPVLLVLHDVVAES